MTDHEISPEEALEGFFRAIRDQAAKNPAFRAGLLDAIGVTVVLRGEEALPALDPVVLALQGLEVFRSTLLSFKLLEIKKIVKPHLTAEAFKAARTKEQLAAEMWEIASAQIADQVPQTRR